MRHDMNAPLELRINAKHRIVLSTLQDDVLLEVETPTHAKEGNGWGLIVQLRLEAEHIAALHAYLAERHNWPPAAA
jgi:hypothetical protein